MSSDLSHTDIDPAAWAVQAGLTGLDEPDLLRGFCKRACAYGIPIARAIVAIDTLHPVHEGRVFRWSSANAKISETTEYGRTTRGGEGAETWRRSPFYHMLETDLVTMRRRPNDPEDGLDFPILTELWEGGHTDCLFLIERFGSAIGEMDGIYISCATDVPDGFTDDQIGTLRRAAQSLGLAIKSASLARIAETLVETYLGRDAGRRVLAGGIERGTADRITAALWFSDLRGYTRITDTSPPAEIIPFLNDYADAVISSVQEAGGDVLKLVGDGTLAIFNSDEIASACHCALKAESLMRARVATLNRERAAAGLAVTSVYLGLNVGEVFYGNIGAQNRLDFTVVGPAVNEVSRVGAMCRSAERDVLVSAAFSEAATQDDRARLVSVGRYALRGVGRAQELFTLDPALMT